jgi:hypothetical protein
MLFKREILDQIVQGNVTQAFRVWKKPTVKSGGTLVTSVGILKVIEVSIVGKNIDQKELEHTGISENELAQQLKREGDLFRITFRYGGEDPRIALQNKVISTREEFLQVQNILKKMDSGKFGPWTSSFLNLIQRHPETLAQHLADKLEVEKVWFKTQVRRLKKHGLTISLGVGYKLSPRGESYLRFNG